MDAKTIITYHAGRARHFNHNAIASKRRGSKHLPRIDKDLRDKHMAMAREVARLVLIESYWEAV